jgi:Fe-S-cluster containining protein
MRGTDHQPARCAALTGTIGQRVACGIYEWRPNPCRELEPGSDACLQARRLHQLHQPLTVAPVRHEIEKNPISELRQDCIRKNLKL